jgi:hypothetical protein
MLPQQPMDVRKLDYQLVLPGDEGPKRPPQVSSPFALGMTWAAGLLAGVTKVGDDR